LLKVKKISWEHGASKTEALRKYAKFKPDTRDEKTKIKAFHYGRRFKFMSRKEFLEYIQDDPELVVDYGKKKLRHSDILLLLERNRGYTLAAIPHLLTEKQQAEACVKYPELMAEHMPMACPLQILWENHYIHAVSYRGTELTKTQVHYIMGMPPYRDLLMEEIPLQLTKRQYALCIEHCIDDRLDTAAVMLRSLQKNETAALFKKHGQRIPAAFEGESRFKLAEQIRKMHQKFGSIPENILYAANLCIAEAI
jgi:hypothetical protein